jgi:TonB family protein
MTEVWTKWESEVINGQFRLRRFLGGSEHSAVFLTEYKAQNLPDAALKLVPAIPTLTEAQLSHWTTAATLSHPHLMRLLESGRCELGGLQFLFVVMEYAEQTLSQILPRRALTPDEVREMLPPTLDALAFLHRNHLVQGRLRPSNILVVNDQLKLASDTVHPAGDSAASIAKSSLYDPPEARDGSSSAAGDIWGLGVTIVEALTQHPPSWPDRRFENVSLPTTLPPAFMAIARQCLNRNPASRPSVADLEALIKRAPQAQVVAEPSPPVSVAQPPESVPQPPVAIPQSLARAAVASATSPQEQEPPKLRLFVALTVLLIVLLAVWAGLRRFQMHLNSQQPASSTSQFPSQRAAASATVAQNPEMSTAAPPESSTPPSSAKASPLKQAAGSAFVLHEEIPEVPRHARETIHGRIQVSVRVTVDRSGNVIHEALQNPGPSRYFARLASEAARKWKFAPADNQNSRTWLLRFDFTRDGATGRTDPPALPRHPAIQADPRSE